jgi:hypothetical protein
MLRSRTWVPGLLATLIVSCTAGSPNDTAGSPNDSPQVEVITPDFQDVSRPLSEMAKDPVPETFELSPREAEPVRPIPHMHPQLAGQQPDPVVQSAIGGPLIPSTSVNFEGMGTGLAGFTVQSAPPDTDGDIGPNHFVQVVNSSVTIFNRTGGILLGPVLSSTFWNGFAGQCANTNNGDGTVRYDRIADRWVIGQLSFASASAGPFFECVAVSTTPDPTGTYNRYQFQYTGLNDYPKMALWPDGYYTTYNIFNNGATFAGGLVCAFDRAKMLVGGAATQQCFNVGTAIGGLLASDMDGPTLPPAGSPNFILALDTNALDFFKMHVDFATPANSTLTGPTVIPTAAFTELCNGGTCVVQPGTTQRLDSLADRLMNRLVYRNFTDHEALLVSHAVTAGTGGGVRFYELRSPATTPTIFQQGTFAPDSAFRWMSSMAFDGSGNIAMGYTTSSSTINPSVRFTGRLTSDPLGTMGQGEGIIVAGTGAQIGNLSRWGDYSSMNIDPTDDCTFWYTQEYMGASGSFNWRTRVGAFKFATCGAVANDFSITVSPASQTVHVGASTTYTINTAVTSGAAQTVNLSASGLPAGVTASFNPASVTAGASSTLTLTVAATAAAGTTQFTITGTGTSATHTTNASVTVVNNANKAPTVTFTSPTNGSTVRRTLNIAATATDADGTVVSVRFNLPDGTSVTDTAAPFSAQFDTRRVANGSAVFKATATDNKGATGTASVTVTVAN